ncbi:MAG: hypothetical protein A2849_03205 [Candidatus Taylorbacteria bacterium RIFCSPHIGHO2_01_FULL_51_15]|uniref:Metallopeptidase family protein n=1 Tax=Candidatus Taylorbacteria bacterium RIFCSPHIGHO2_01_FULL_51_15 TaxID=1802304 RepID=A0A1G2MBN5_9BACT|nr:MAG: hypothetical protein A2849_03205 [Candidatus Taylorbacteria bacterium RIFCSPHIGHO2_01_FULL_51_15]
MYTVSLSVFESFVREGVEAVPERFRSRITNVVFLVEEEPTPKQRHDHRLSSRETLFGLYEGVPRTVRGADYGGLVLPDRITIFKKSIEHEAASLEEVRAQVIETVWHEVAHHFGLDETRVQRRESERKKLPTKAGHKEEKGGSQAFAE